MKVSVKSNVQARQLTICLSEMELEKLTQASFYQAEQAVQQIVNQIGQELTVALLQSRAPTQPLLEPDGQTWLGAMPETGKATFTQRLTTRVAQVKTLYPHALHVVLSDGVRWNW